MRNSSRRGHVSRPSLDAQIARAGKAIDRLRARGVPIVFCACRVREYYAYEEKHLPRAQTWDRLLRETGSSPGWREGPKPTNGDPGHACPIFAHPAVLM